MRPPQSAAILAEGEGFEPPRTYALTVFKTAAINRSAIPPCRRHPQPHDRLKYSTEAGLCQKSAGNFAADPLHPGHVRPQHLRHDDRAVGLLVVFQHRDHHARQGQA